MFDAVVDFAAVRYLIWDLGGVLYQLDFPRFEREMRALESGQGDRPFWYHTTSQPALFSQYERGELPTAEFRQALRQEFAMTATDAEFDRAWNSILVGVFPDRLAVLTQLQAQNYRMAILSNINELHLAHLQAECAPLFHLCDRCFFSFRMGCRKPEPEIFQKVLAETGFPQSRATLFVDDSPQNVEAAIALGLQGLWLERADWFGELARGLGAEIERKTVPSVLR